MFKFFVAGGPVFMAVLTIVLVCMFFAAWKAPRWVKEIGAFAIVFGIFSTLLGITQMLGVVQEVGDIDTGVLCGGMKVTLIPTIYGIIIYMISLIVRIIEKPRI
ncbi:MAG TPA: MotA/TolQ/ExbB proton channel family protein [Candidatus Cryptobacteroides intestinipullorum]|nr:MotA/TolQ/ExbB proton channel family protein [Candidatus Cryptobacteroides intestinipullorum]